MKRTLYLTSLRLSMTGSIAWTISILLYVLLVVYLYPSMRDVLPYEQFLQAMPEQFRGAIGVADEAALQMFFSGDTIDFRAWLNTEYMTWLPLMLGIYGIVYCGGLVSREVDRGTMDLVLSQPVRRTTFLLSKFVAFASVVVGIVLVSYAVLSIGSLGIDVTLDYRYLALAHVMVVLFVLAMAGYSTLASCAWLEPGRSVAIPGFVTALVYFLNILAPSIKSVSWLQKGSLFYYYDPLGMVFTGKVSWAGIGVYLGVMLGSLMLAMIVFQRKDIVR
jgi:ABC-2 type transport system permease protein